MLVEVIACTLDDAVVAREAGADRVELCLAPEVGGLTPYLETVEQIRGLSPFPVVVMVRPQPGGFDRQSIHILAQIERILELGLPNIQIITGALRSNRELDLPALRKIRDVAKGVPLICHRCFDLTPFPLVALEQLIDLGFDRILTSGQAPTAILGMSVISSLLDQADGRIEILPAVGIRPHNVEELVRATEVTQVHASCFDDAPASNGNVDFGPTLRVSAMKVKGLVAAAKAL